MMAIRISGIGVPPISRAKTEAQRGRGDPMRAALLAALVTAILFLIGQIFAWRELTQAGYVLADNPANSFFYVLTALHGLHIIGGLVGLAVVSVHAWTPAWPRERLKLGVELVAMYWHFLLFVWLGLFVLLMGWAASLVDICRQLLT